MENTKEKIYRAIKRRIINLDLRPGDVLSDRRLAEELNVSRTPVREALTLLQKENYVVQKPGRGFFVREIRLKDIEDMFMVREALEVAALKLAARNSEERNIEIIAQLLHKHARIIENYQPKGKFLEDADFHKALAQMSRNRYLFDILESIFERIQILKSIESVPLARVKIAHEQHLKIFDHFRRGEYEEAQEMLSQHILDSKDNIISRIIRHFDVLHFSGAGEAAVDQNETNP